MTTSDNGFTNKEILVALDQKVDAGFAEVKALINAGHLDHEARIRKLEEKDYARQGENSFKKWLVPILISIVSAATMVFSYLH